MSVIGRARSILTCDNIRGGVPRISVRLLLNLSLSVNMQGLHHGQALVRGVRAQPRRRGAVAVTVAAATQGTAVRPSPVQAAAAAARRAVRRSLRRGPRSRSSRSRFNTHTPSEKALRYVRTLLRRTGLPIVGYLSKSQVISRIYSRKKAIYVIQSQSA